MISTVMCSVLLSCRIKGSNEEYRVDVVKDPRFSNGKGIVGHYKVNGVTRAAKRHGDYTASNLKAVLAEKIGECFAIEIVNGQSFMRGGLDDAVNTIACAVPWKFASTEQAKSRCKAKEVQVTFNVGQVAPIW